MHSRNHNHYNIYTIYILLSIQSQKIRRLSNLKFLFQLKKTPTAKSESQKIIKPKGKKGTSPSTTKSPKSDAAKARDEARRKMIEEKKRQMKAKQCQSAGNDGTFVQF